MSLLKILKKRSVIVTLIIVVLIIGGVYYAYNRNQKPVYDVVVVKRGTVKQEVSVTGRVKPSEDVSLAFERGGRVAKISVKIGDQVIVDQPLIELNVSELSADLNKAEAVRRSAEAGLKQYQAAIDSQRAKLDELRSGIRPEELAVAETQVNNARQVLADAEINLTNTMNQATIALANLYDSVSNILNDAYAKADDAVTKQVDEFFTDDNANPRLSYVTSNSQAQIDAESQRLNMTNLLSYFKDDLTKLGADQVSLDAAIEKSESRLTLVRNFLIRLNDTLNASNSLSQSVLTTYKGYLNTARANINTAMTNVSAQRQSIASKKSVNEDSISAAQASVNQAKNNLKLAEDELFLKKAGATVDQLKAQEAAVRQAEASLASQQAAVSQSTASVDNLRAQIAKTILISPINGVVTKQDTEVGEIVAANSPIIGIISGGFSAQGGPASGWEIEAAVPEADIAKVKIGSPGEITLDAYGDDVKFTASVVSIDPAEKIIEGVATYKMTLLFAKDDDRVKSGMTANVTISGEKRDNVIAIPQRTIFTKSGEKMVEILENGSLRETAVKTGLRSSDGNVEIIDGLKEGDQVVTSIKEK